LPAPGAEAFGDGHAAIEAGVFHVLKIKNITVGFVSPAVFSSCTILRSFFSRSSLHLPLSFLLLAQKKKKQKKKGFFVLTLRGTKNGHTLLAQVATQLYGAGF
jgi:hypothetical protein